MEAVGSSRRCLAAGLLGVSFTGKDAGKMAGKWRDDELKIGLPSPEPIGDTAPELVAVPHGKKAEEDGNSCDCRPKTAGKRCDLLCDEKEGDDGSEYKAAAETKTLLELVWFGDVIH